jgi:hypothetical protein
VELSATEPARMRLLIGFFDLRTRRFSSSSSASVMTACVQVFGRRHEEAIHALRRPASEKRQCTKSREVGHWLGSERYGDLMLAPISMMSGRPARQHLDVCTSEVGRVQ